MLVKHGHDAQSSALQSPLKWFCPRDSSSRLGQGESDSRAQAPKASAFSRFKIYGRKKGKKEEWNKKENLR